MPKDHWKPQKDKQAARRSMDHRRKTTESPGYSPVIMQCPCCHAEFTSIEMAHEPGGWCPNRCGQRLWLKKHLREVAFGI